MIRAPFYFILIILNLLGDIQFCQAQDIPPVARYTSEEYEADNQNWSVTQTDDRTLFFANSKGLLKFDGVRWDLLGSPNNTILRSVYAIDNEVYSGAYMEFGVWKKNKNSVYTYHSLSKDLQLVEDEQFWNITTFNNYIVFQSLDAIYLYHLIDKSIEIIKPENEITKMVVKNNILYYHIKHRGLFKQVNGEEIAVNTTDEFKNSILINLYELDNQLYAQTQYKGIINISDNRLFKPENSLELFSNLSVYNSLQLKNADVYLGTISHGLIKISNGKVSLHLNQENSLSNNTVLNLFQDKDDKIWLGLDNGINCINTNSNISIFNDQNGKLGTIYASIYFENTLYLGTNQGLFYYDKKDDKYKLIKNTKGQVWSLFSHNDNLFCGHHNGTFLIEDKMAKLITNVQGTWMFRSIDDKTIFTGNYEGLNVLKYKNGAWQYDRKIKGFDISTKYFEFIDSTHILVNHEYKGIFKLSLDKNLTEVLSVKKDNSIEKGLFSSIVKLKDKIFYAYRDGIFQYDKETSQFKKDTFLSNIYSPKYYSSGRLVKTKDEKLWIFSKTDINYISLSSVKDEYLVRKIPISAEARHQISGYENVSQINPDTYLIGKSDGYIKIETSELQNVQPKISINTVLINNKSDEYFLNIKSQEENLISNNFNNLSIELTALNYNPLLKSEYQYKLSGYNNHWSEWDDSGNVLYKNLPYGDYEFLAKSRIGKENISNIASFRFTIGRPFYLSYLMIIVYIIILILSGTFIHLLYKRNYKKKRLKLQKNAERKLELKELESQKEIMKVNNDKLRLDVENKNRELAISTMSLVKKNEFLSQIKSDLKPLQSQNKIVKKVLKIINNNLNNTDDWKFFEEAFNNADKDFFKKLKDKHADLTPNELKLCAYLRLNLTSKEIAPLFNISTKSVEIKRYRLRKKMDLSRNESLTNYILSL